MPWNAVKSSFSEFCIKFNGQSEPIGYRGPRGGVMEFGTSENLNANKG